MPSAHMKDVLPGSDRFAGGGKKIVPVKGPSPWRTALNLGLAAVQSFSFEEATGHSVTFFAGKVYFRTWHFEVFKSKILTQEQKTFPVAE